MIVKLDGRPRSWLSRPSNDSSAAALGFRKKLKRYSCIHLAVETKSVVMGAPFRAGDHILQPDWFATDILADCEQHRGHCLIVVLQEILPFENGDLGAKLR